CLGDGDGGELDLIVADLGGEGGLGHGPALDPRRGAGDADDAEEALAGGGETRGGHDEEDAAFARERRPALLAGDAVPAAGAGAGWGSRRVSMARGWPPPRSLTQREAVRSGGRSGTSARSAAW